MHETYRISINPSNHQTICVTGKIVWSDLYGINDEKGSCYIGVCLVEIAEEERHLLNDLIPAYLQ